VNLTEARARSQLVADDFKVKVDRRTNDTVQSGLVFDQNPDEGTRLKKGSTVTIVVSTGVAPTPVPNVVGQDVQSAHDELARSGFTNVRDTPRTDETQPKGRVLEQDPKANDKAAKDALITLVVSSGREQATVPDVTGRDLGSAANLLGQRGFQTTTRDQASDTVDSGKVIGTEPGAGTQADKGSLVTIVVSTGPAPVEVPDVIGRTEAQARSTLEAAGFNVDAVPQDVTDSGDVGNVLDQDPKGNATADKGSTVVITVGRAAK
jgi:serine/threonine-protein kinase